MAALTLARVYQHSFHAYPNWTLAITGGCLSAAGDIVAQLTQNAVSWIIDHLYHWPTLFIDGRQRPWGQTPLWFSAYYTFLLLWAWNECVVQIIILSNWLYHLSIFLGPVMGRWNVFLERRFPSCSPQIGKLSIKSLSKRVAADQLIMYSAFRLSCSH